ncbi:hypothetical protein GQ602_006878 [Ophiocordyceps camponoti-floridani]|uniref:Uncharacterized protein n=1 Tax=Ophiocordyceps camponoti-floridani TaxID=2030778 RepID=A0A8H4VB80_9HYPO|nr:hypothetical protein GQ602_006878 [Ophiocordyceps camponoti-floridani]
MTDEKATSFWSNLGLCLPQPVQKQTFGCSHPTISDGSPDLFATRYRGLIKRHLFPRQTRARDEPPGARVGSDSGVDLPFRLRRRRPD